MGLFSHKTVSSLPQDILDSVHTMQDDLDGKKPALPVAKSSVLPGSENTNPFAFSSAPSTKNMAPVNENGLTSPITITSTDASHAEPDPKDSSPFLSSDQDQPAAAVKESEIPSESKPVKPIFSREKPVGSASFVSENVALGANPPSYFPEAESHKKKGIFIVGVIMLILAILAAGVFAYFSFFEKTADIQAPQDVSEQKTGENETPAEDTVADTEENQPFTFSSPNYLPIDVETVTAEQFRATLLEKHAILESSGIADTAVEFFVTDKTNTPIAFARLAVLMGLALPQAVMDEIDESFSLYLYNDNHIPRVGLALSMKNEDLLRAAVKKDESAIPFSLQALYLDPSVTNITAGAFKDGAYKTYQTRYFNMGASGLSNDYTFTEKHWVIGTSQNVFRKILDTFGTAL